MSAAITRRKALTVVPAVVVVATMAIPAMAAPDPDPHVKWWAENQALCRKMSALEGGARDAALDAELDRYCTRAIALDNLIVETEPHTLTGLAIQLRVLEDIAECSEITPEELGRVATSAERLAGGAS